MYAYCQNKALVDLSLCKSIDDVIIKMKEKAEVTPPGNWIKGVNFDQSKFKENRFPTRYDLDKISSEHPLIIRRCCLHAIVANSLALKIAGVDKNFKVTSGGIVEFDENGEPNGIIREQSTKIFDEIIPDPLSDEKEKLRIMDEVLKDMSSKGVTTIHTYAARIWKYDEDLNLYKKLEKENKLPVRVTVCLDEIFENKKLTEDDKNNPFRMVQYGAYKLFTDGSLGSRSAALNEPYFDDKGNKGFVVCSQEELNEKVLISYRKGLQPAIHAIGDAALDMTLTAIENCLEITKSEGMSEEDQNSRLPFRIIHVQMINDDLLERMKKLPLVLDIQPIFLTTDLHWIEDRIGPERTKNSYCWKTLYDSGFILTGGSDCPVESFDPVPGIYAAASRCDIDGYPDGGFLPEEKLSIYESLSLFTKNPHFATGQQDKLGTIEVGKFADLAILDRDPFEIDEKDILKIKVLKTFVAGKKVFEL
jgi:predicted amidohydrolase YtcJ